MFCCKYNYLALTSVCACRRSLVWGTTLCTDKKLSIPHPSPTCPRGFTSFIEFPRKWNSTQIFIPLLFGVTDSLHPYHFSDLWTVWPNLKPHFAVTQKILRAETLRCTSPYGTKVGSQEIESSSKFIVQSCLLICGYRVDLSSYFIQYAYNQSKKGALSHGNLYSLKEKKPQYEGRSVLFARLC